MNLVVRSLRHYLGANAAIGLGVAAACAALSGALLVGTSVRGSLREMAVDRLGRFTHAIESSRWFDASLADRVRSAVGAEVVPAILQRVTVRSAGGPAQASRVALVAAGDAFWKFGSASGGDAREIPAPPDAPPTAATGRHGVADPERGSGATLSRALARDLGVRVGDELILRMPAYSPIPSESLLGRRDDPVRTLRVAVERIVPDRGLGRFSLVASQQASRNLFVPLHQVQRALGQPGRVNTLLADAACSTEALADAVRGVLTPADAGLRLRVDARQAALVVESEQLVLSEAAEAIATDAARATGMTARRVLTYLANTVRRVSDAEPPGSPPASLPYAIVAALDLPEFPPPTIRDAPRDPAAPPEVWLNAWAARRLSSGVGDQLEISYYMLNPGGDLRTEQCRLRVAGVVEMQGVFDDPGLTPQVPGIAEARTMGDWDPPFPIDYQAIGPDDERYWEQHRTTPKAFVRLETGVALWAPPRETAARFGRLTSIRLALPEGADPGASAQSFARELRQRLSLEAAGLRVRGVREEALRGATPATDFSGLFLAFSLFVIVAAVLLATLLLRLEVERRARQVGTLLALGYAPRRVGRLLLGEFACVAGAGAVLGAPLATGYAWLMLAGLRTLWISAVGTVELHLHVAASDLAIGSATGAAMSLASAWYSLRRLRHTSVTALLAGRAAAPLRCPSERAGRAAGLLAGGLGAVAAGCGAAALFVGGTVQAGASFAGGAALLAAAIAGSGAVLRRAAPGRVAPGAWPVERLALRNLARRPDRSVLTLAMVACAAFIVAAVAASRHMPRFDPGRRDAGHGGYALWAEMDAPLLYDLGRAQARTGLGVPPALESVLKGCDVQALRRRPGDDASCLNLYKPVSPAVLGVPSGFVERGGFAFSASLAATDAERRNPWRLLDREFDDGAVPVIGDANTVTWSLHLGLGDDLTLATEDGRRARLRVVATLSGSVFQSELLIGEARFLRMFPRTGGYSVLLVDPPPGEVAPVRQALAAGLAEHGIDIRATADRIAAFLAVEHTYLATFQQLGGMGLLLGTLGVVTLVLRNVLERRAELALLAALGFRAARVRRLMWLEALLLVALGLAAGTLGAALAVAANVAAHPGDVPWLSLAGLLAVILLVAGAASAAAVRAALPRAPIEALRAER